MMRPGPAILGYHRIANSEWDPQQLCVSKENFAQQLEVLRKNVRLLTLQQIDRGLAEGRVPARSVAITFDDGYIDTYEDALPLLEQQELPATVFVVTGTIGGYYWWDEVQSLVETANELPERIDLSIDGRSFRWSRHARDARNRRSLVKGLGGFFRLLPFSDQQSALDELRSLLPSSTENECTSRAMSAEQVAELGACELIDIGSHTVSHQSLGRISPEQQSDELMQSKKALEEITGQPVRSFSYPNGITSADSPRIASELGYTIGCTSREGVVSSSSNPYLLPRLWVGNWDGERFAKWLRLWLR